ncbi:MAG: CocE/NonD family hydrolase C-terminal non-catalytic domain-containing protein, partial [Actinomycetota bacterium]
ALEPGRGYEVSIDLSATSWVFEAGHHVRVALAGADWPNVWPPPSSNVITIDADRSRIVLPVAPPLENPVDPGFLLPPAERGDAPEATKAVDATEEGAKEPVYRIEHDALAHQAHVVIDHGSPYDVEIGARVAEDYFGKLTVSTDDPSDARAEGRARFEIAWPEATASAEVNMTLVSDAATYRVHLDLDVRENGKTLWSRRWDRDIPRRLQ